MYNLYEDIYFLDAILLELNTDSSIYLLSKYS